MNAVEVTLWVAPFDSVFGDQDATSNTSREREFSTERNY
jgi:hypothetical protein